MLIYGHWLSDACFSLAFPAPGNAAAPISDVGDMDRIGRRLICRTEAVRKKGHIGLVIGCALNRVERGGMNRVAERD